VSNKHSASEILKRAWENHNEQGQVILTMAEAQTISETLANQENFILELQEQL
jgi:hypothetical protein